MRCGSGGLIASLNSLGIALPPITKWGSKVLKDKVMPGVISGEKLPHWRSSNPVVAQT
jgi:acyl-CoA dehydrogenase